MRIIRRIAALLLCTALLSCCCSCKKEEVSPVNRMFRYALASDPNNLDPQSTRSADAWTVIRNLFEGLCRVDEHGAVLPGAAESWTHNNNFTEFTFTLRPDLKWSDGTPLIAADFVYAVRRALSPETKCPMVEDLFCIAGAEAFYNGEIPIASLGVRALSRNTVQFTLTDSFEDFPAETAKSAYMPCNKAFFESTGGKYGMEAGAMLTNGPFRLRARSGWMHNDYIYLLRNEHYVGETTVVPYGVQFNIGLPENPITAIQNGEAHAALLTSGQEQSATEAGLPQIAFAETTWGLALNCNAPGFSDVRIRQAFVTAIDRSLLTRYYPASATETTNLIPDAVTVHGKPYRTQAGLCTNPNPGFSPAQLLAQGLEGLGLIKLPSVSVLCVDTPGNRLLVNELLIAWRQAMSCYVNIETVKDEKELARRVAEGKYQIALTGMQAVENSTRAFLNTVAGRTGYDDDSFQAMASVIPEAPIQNSFALENRLIQNGAFFPLYTLDTVYALGATVTDLVIYPFGGGLDFRNAGRLA